MKEIEDTLDEAIEKLEEVSQLRFNPKLQREIQKIVIAIEDLKSQVPRILDHD